MAVGDLTVTVLGTYNTPALAATALDAENSGAATAGADTTTFPMVAVGNGMQIVVFKVVRAAA